jgi:hypothetical protein
MYIKIIPKRDGYEPYLEGGCTLNSGIVDFRLFFTGLRNKQDFEKIKYALTEAIANTVNDFGKAYDLGKRW